MFGRVAPTCRFLFFAVMCASCDPPPNPICDYFCADTGLSEGNASISGFPPLDAFFSSVVSFGRISDTLARAMAADLREIQAIFYISDEQVTQAGSLAAALEVLLDQRLVGDLEMQTTLARCPIDTEGVLMAEIDCKALALCEVDSDLGTLDATCAGTCSGTQSEMPKCEAGAAQSCTRLGSNIPCTGQCVGTCTEGGASSSSMVTLACKGRCNGECTQAAVQDSCAKDATVSCASEDSDAVTCASICDGEVTVRAGAPCPATPMCQASTSADATLHAQCTFPLVELSYDLDPSLDEPTRTQLEVSLGRMRVTLPQILASVRRAEGVLRAGRLLSVGAEGSVPKAIREVADHVDLPNEIMFRLTYCSPRELERTGFLIADYSSALQEQVSAVQDLLRILRVAD